ncbi:MAG: MFS transporter [Deltaproteobacteria bacterium]|nr:MFS transporter [Deltaproteobacteria bacterium]
MEEKGGAGYGLRKSRFFYGWYIVAVGFLANVASAFSLASTLSVFLKPLTQEMGVSRGVYSLLRSGETLLHAGLAPVIGSLVDRYGPRWLMAIGALVAGTGYLLLSQVHEFWQFALVRWSVVTLGDSFMGYMVVNVTISRWFIRQRGRAIAFSAMGIGFAKAGMPVIAAALLVWLGWRLTWATFGIITFALVIGPAFFFMRRRPEDLGLHPDGAPGSFPETIGAEKNKRPASAIRAAPEVAWSRREAVRTPAFWFIVLTFGVSSIGVTGLNLHVFPYVIDIGHSPIVAATVMSVIALMQMSSPLVWGFVSERVGLPKVTMLKFLIQAVGLSLAITAGDLAFLYLGFFLYGIGLGGTMVLQDVLWANYFGRLSLGAVRGLGLLLTNFLAACGPPFFGFLFDMTRSYYVSFALFACALLASALLSLCLRPPKKRSTKTIL